MMLVNFPVRLVMLPITDYLAALQACAARLDTRAVAVAILAAAVSWWIYVPIHELAHALGCWIGGGTVTRLEIAPVYGAAALQRVFPFVAVGSEYAGQLTGFDTHGNDLTYLFTDFCPFILTVLVGVPLLRAVSARRRSGLGGWVMLGIALPIAYAPFISLFGDYYEMGSIVVTRAVRLFSPSFDVVSWRSDDFFKLLQERLADPPGELLPNLAGLSLSLAVGVVLAFLTYWAGALWASAIVGKGDSHAARG